MGKKILTLNIGASAIALAEYEAGGRSAKLLKYGTAALAAPLDSGNAETILTPALLSIVREKGIRPGRVAISVAGQMVFPRIAAIPMSSGGDRFAQLVRNEIEQNIPFPIDEMICDDQILGDTEAGDKSVLIVAAKTEQIESITDALQAAGFSPEIVGVAPFAVTNVLKAATAGDPSCSVLLDIGAKTTSLVIVEGEKLYNRSIPVAGNAITKEIGQALGCSAEEAEQIKCESAYVSMGGVTEDEDETLDKVSKVCRAVLTRLHAEISRSINFYRSQQNGSAPVRLFLTGGTSMLPQLAEFFQDSLGIEVDYLNPFATISVGGGVDASALEADGAVLAATAGMALQAGGGAALSLNLMPPSILEAKAEAARIPFVAIGAAAFLAAAGLWYMATSSETADLQGKVPKAAARANQAVQMKTARDDARKAAEAATDEANRLAALLPRRGAALRHLNLVREAIGEDLWIAKWEDSVKAAEAEAPADDGSSYGAGAPSAPHDVKVSTVTIRGWEPDMVAFVNAFNENAETPCDTAQAVVKTRLEQARNGERKLCAAVDSGSRLTYGVPGSKKKPLVEFTVTIQFSEEETACK